ncbi:hypothetical protein PRZ03_00395 [Paucibacter sp. hw8]|uniref:Uncharacterized protein n=1 Tax=Roseateles albus TaxID=2987525 RepID=A0ABT5KAG3_9BURK|nr:hypothetical protein [Roseateles albus]
MAKNKAPSLRTKGPRYEEIEGDQLLSMLISIATGLRKLSGTFECRTGSGSLAAYGEAKFFCFTTLIPHWLTTNSPDQRFKRDVPAISSPRAQMPSPAP